MPCLITIGPRHSCEDSKVTLTGQERSLKNKLFGPLATQNSVELRRKEGIAGSYVRSMWEKTMAKMTHPYQSLDFPDPKGLESGPPSKQAKHRVAA